MKCLAKIFKLFCDFKNNLKSGFRESVSKFYGIKGVDPVFLNEEPDLDNPLKEQLIKFYVEGNPVNLVDRDELFYQAAQFVVLTQSCSITAIQREFSIGLGHAKIILDQIESAGIISQHRNNEGRKVLVKDEISLRELITSLPHIEINNCIDQLDSFYKKYKEEIESRRKENELLQLEELKKTEAEVLKLMKLEKILKKRLPETTSTRNCSK
jgi:hypothetical protein